METVMQKAVPDEMRGRVFSFNNVLLNTLLLGSLLAGARFLSEAQGNGLGITGTETRLAVWIIIVSVLGFVGAMIAAFGFPKRLSIADIHESDSISQL